MQSILPFLCDRMNALVASLLLNRIVAIPSKLLKIEGAETLVRCLHFALRLAELGLAPKILLKTCNSCTFCLLGSKVHILVFMPELIRVRPCVLPARSTMVMLRSTEKTTKGKCYASLSLFYQES